MFKNTPLIEQVKHYELREYQETTDSVTYKIDKKEALGRMASMKGEALSLEDAEFLVQDDVIVGIRIGSEDLFCFGMPVGCIDCSSYVEDPPPCTTWIITKYTVGKSFV